MDKVLTQWEDIKNIKIMAFKIKHLVKSNLASRNNINNFPGADVEYDPCLTKDHIFNNLHLLFYHCVRPIIEAFGEDDIAITSAYRSRSLQRAIGGNLNSVHTRGQAVDIISFSRPTDILWNWCNYNLPQFNQLIWEYPERGHIQSKSPSRGFDTSANFSWVHISYTKNNHPKTTSISTKREDVHEMYHSENSTRIGDYTHNIVIADYNLI